MSPVTVSKQQWKTVCQRGRRRTKCCCWTLSKKMVGVKYETVAKGDKRMSYPISPQSSQTCCILSITTQQEMVHLENKTM